MGRDPIFWEGGGHTVDTLYQELYEYGTLEAAFEAVLLFLNNLPEDNEEWLINLQNHLVWRSYRVGEDPDCDAVVLEAACAVMRHHGLRARDLTGELRKLLDDLTLA